MLSVFYNILTEMILYHMQMLTAKIYYHILTSTCAINILHML